ncbi:hypothetical protein FRC04_007519 [Tulasnella sp. 424]|nr:hypothetical protein FRC04_007519 [Tulasnella sp. 424]KAG8966834.1 hypothetical protein FRC05_002397 [Tulasnella sp. 425]
MRFATVFVSTLVASFAGVLPQVNASPAPTPAPAPVDLGSIVDSATADVASAATNFATHVTSDHERIFTEIGGHAYTVINDGAGDAFTLATGAAGDVTSIGGALYTVATGSIPTGTANAGYINSPASIFPGTPVLASLLTMAGGVLVGAYVVF